jgi:hypothetical protein
MVLGSLTFWYNKVIRKVRQRQHRKPPFGHIGMRFQKPGNKKYTELQGGVKLSLAANLALNWVCPLLSFPERFQPITAAAMCTVTIMFSSLVYLILRLSISYPYLIKLHDLADNSQEGIQQQMRAATQAQQGMTFWITLIPLQICIVCTLGSNQYSSLWR